MRRRRRISSGEARRIALAAQGFDRQRPARPDDLRHYRRALAAITVLQLDYVNVLLPAHFLIVWSRIGAYDRQRFCKWLYSSGEYTEQWAHEASIVSQADWPLLAHRRCQFTLHDRNPLRSLPAADAYLTAALDIVRRQGPTTAADLPDAENRRREPGEWYRSVQRSALECLFGQGRLAVVDRLPNFQRVYDLPERLIDPMYRLQAPGKSDSQRMLLAKAATALGIATAADLADYYRMRPSEVTAHIQRLCEDGNMQAVEVEGWSERAYLAANARNPRLIPGASLLSPFDPVVWYRPRAQRLFNFEYRIEIYVPAARRRWGYYVLPFRVGDRIVARIDLKADRKSGSLLVQAAYCEEHAPAADTANRLAAELWALARWLDLVSVKVRRRRRFERCLAGCLRDQRR